MALLLGDCDTVDLPPGFDADLTAFCAGTAQTSRCDAATAHEFRPPAVVNRRFEDQTATVPTGVVIRFFPRLLRLPEEKDCS